NRTAGNGLDLGDRFGRRADARVRLLGHGGSWVGATTRSVAAGVSGCRPVGGLKGACRRGSDAKARRQGPGSGPCTHSSEEMTAAGRPTRTLGSPVASPAPPVPVAPVLWRRVHRQDLRAGAAPAR